MIKMIIGMFLIAFDGVISPDGRIKIDLLPDFIGYGILAYSFYRMFQNAVLQEETMGDRNQNHPHSKKQSSRNKRNESKKQYKYNRNNREQNKNSAIAKDKAQFKGFAKKNKAALWTTVKQGVIAAIILCFVSYIAYMLDMYGKMEDMNTVFSLVISFLLDLGMLFIVFMYIQILSGMQGQNSHFQIKRMLTLWKIMILCVVSEYISLPIDTVAMTFIIFEKVVEVIFMVYMYTSARTYKIKYLNKK